MRSSEYLKGGGRVCIIQGRRRLPGIPCGPMCQSLTHLPRELVSMYTKLRSQLVSERSQGFAQLHRTL